AEQERAKTKRKKADVEAQVARGYKTAEAVADAALKEAPDSWPLLVAKAALLHDQIVYRKETTKDGAFSKTRDECMALFQKAAASYAAVVKDLPAEEQSTEPFDLWFYASLGSCDLSRLDEKSTADLKQPAVIKQALGALPGELADQHMGRFANLLFTRMSGVKPAAKSLYLKTGFEIVGDRKEAREARKLHDYYKDLVQEIKLETRVDGDVRVGSKQPFGVFVDLKHSPEIERESGGFGRYLQNQSSGMMFAYNYGRPIADYRDRFQEGATQALTEDFEVVSITFQSDKVTSRATVEPGWRTTPYAYLLLKPRGPQIDRLPSLRLDLDFLDTSGFVILPIESPALPIDAGATSPPPRPIEQLEVVQTLDERQADNGKLLLEVKATARGLVGDLSELVDLKPAGFEIAKVEDGGLSVARFDEDAVKNQIISERLFTIALEAPAGAPIPKSFAFGSATAEETKMVYQRYRDADLVAVGETVDLEESYEKRSYALLGWMAAGGAALVGLFGLV
ncbi:MAG: hypothetical protein ACRDD1_21230, partial [Planctomycetia bacterium]